MRFNPSSGRRVMTRSVSQYDDAESIAVSSATSSNIRRSGNPYQRRMLRRPATDEYYDYDYEYAIAKPAVQRRNKFDACFNQTFSWPFV